MQKCPNDQRRLRFKKLFKIPGRFFPEKKIVL